MQENARSLRPRMEKLLIASLVLALLIALREAAFARNQARYGAPGQQNF